MKGLREIQRSQSGTIPYRLRKGVIEVLLITNRSGTKWIVPKGEVEPGLTPAESAEEEAWEEAGVRGRISDGPIGWYRYPKYGGYIRIEIFLLEVDEIYDDYPERRLRKRRWRTPEDAVAFATDKDLRSLLKRLEDLVDSHG